MMEAQFFVYTRAYITENDYKLMFSPSNEFCPDEARKFFLQQARGLVNVEEFSVEQYDTLKSPRWMFSRYNGYTLWGVGIMNSELSSESIDNDFKDCVGRPVRGFFGMVLKNDSFSELPFDLSYWKKFYAKYVSPLWMVGKEEFKQKGIAVEESFEQYHCIRPNDESNIQLNVHPNKTIIWGHVSEDEMFATALALKEDVSCVSGLGEISHAYNHKYNYHNAIVDGVTETQSRVYSENKVEKQGEEMTGKREKAKEEEKMIKPKKALRPKSMLILGCIVIIVLMIALCTKKIRKQEHPTSGEKDMNQTELVLPSSTLDSVKK